MTHRNSDMQLITIKRFRQVSTYFERGSMPSENTLRSWIDADEFPGTRIGNRYYIDIDALQSDESALVDRVLHSQV